jgi:hypothetical protein
MRKQGNVTPAKVHKSSVMEGIQRRWNGWSAKLRMQTLKSLVLKIKNDLRGVKLRNEWNNELNSRLAWEIQQLG